MDEWVAPKNDSSRSDVTTPANLSGGEGQWGPPLRLDDLRHGGTLLVTR